MTFVSPLFLWALAAIAVPVIIHLFNFRKYKKVYFTNVKFLKELQQESKSKSRLKEILILTARCLAIASLVLAFSQPVIPDKLNPVKNSGASAVSIYLDNSFSMENVNKQGPLLDLAKVHAKDLIKAFGNADKFQIISNDFEGRHQRFHSKEDALNIVEEIKISPVVRNMSDVVKRQSEFLRSSGLLNKKIYLFTDAQRSTFNLQDIIPDTLISSTIIPLKPNLINNVYTDSCWFETPVQQKGFIQKLHARIVNSGNAAMDAASAKLFLNKQQIAIASFSVDANSETEVLFTFECKQSGLNYGSVKIEDYPVTFDDELFFAFNSKLNVRVCLINGKEQANVNSFTSLFQNDSLFSLTTLSEQTIDYNVFKASDVIILNQLAELGSGLTSELLKFTQKGGALVIVPSLNAKNETYKMAFSELKLPGLTKIDSLGLLKVDKIETASGFYDGVFEKMEDRLNLPVVTKHFVLMQNSRSDFEPILTLNNGDVFFGKTSVNNAEVYLFTSPFLPSSTNFNKHALFVPSFYRICFTSLSPVPLSYLVSANVSIQIKNEPGYKEQPPHVVSADGKMDVIPELRTSNSNLLLHTQGQVNAPGFYTVTHSDADLLPLAFNYSRQESDLTCYTTEELETIITDKNLSSFTLMKDVQSDFSAQIRDGVEGKKLWKLFIILALIFIGIEVLLLRLLK